MPVVLVPTAYRGPAHGESRIEVSGSTLIACFEEIEARGLVAARAAEARGNK